MPVTPYHFGPSCLIGYVFRKWIDFPVFVLANVVIDFEVLIIAYFHLGWPIHRYAHTFLLGAVVGILWGCLAYLIKPVLKLGMDILRINYQPHFFKMVISGILGIWLHVLLDSIYHFDVRPFWPKTIFNPLWGKLSHSQIELLCIICGIIFAILYLMPVFKQGWKKR